MVERGVVLVGGRIGDEEREADREFRTTLDRQ